MGSLDTQTFNNSFEDTKERINNAFEHLREEMKQIQRQDVLLLKQLMYIRESILLLSSYQDKRSYSSSALSSSSQTSHTLDSSSWRRPDVTSWRRPSLTRVQSAPLERNGSEDTIPEEDEDDELADSFNSTASDSPITILFSKCRSPTTDIIYGLGPIPAVFKNLIETSYTPTPRSSILTSDHLTKDLNSSRYIGGGGIYDNSLRRYVTKKRMLTRQRSVEDGDHMTQTVDNHSQCSSNQSSVDMDD